MTSADGMPTSTEVEKALDIARSLIKAGVPVFAASPCPEGCPLTHKRKDGEGNWIEVPHRGGPGHYHLPKQWEKTIPSESWLDPSTPHGYRPGYALAAVGGHVCDFLDVDPRNGGEQSRGGLDDLGEWPITFGRQGTPSGGEHFVVARTGQRKAGGDRGLLPGLDLQSGDDLGQGRGFVWIAPTVRPSKDPADAGMLRAYRWEVEPDLEALAESDEALDSMQGIIARIETKRAAPGERALTARESAPGATSGLASLFPADPDDPFMTPGQAAGLVFGNDRSFSLAEAQDFVRPALLELQTAKIGSIEETANVAAATLSHFVPAFWSADQAFDLLMFSLKMTAYDPNGPSDWDAEKFRAVLDGRRPPLDAWRALKRPEAPAPPSVSIETAPGEEALTTAQKLRKLLVSAKDLAELPAPEPLIHGLLNLDSESWMIGAPGSLKSFIALDMAGCVARGAPWQGRRTEKHDVLYIAAEGQRGMVLRTRAYITEHGHMDGVTFLPYPVQVKSADGQWEALIEIAAELRPGLIVIDTQHRVSAGLEENSATDMGVLVGAVGRLKRATGACILTIHHTGRNGGDARGSSAIDGAQDTELKIERAAPRESLVCTLKQDKQKDMAEGSDKGIPLAMKVIDLGQDRYGHPLSSLVVDPDVDAVHRAMTALQGFSEADVEPWKGMAPESWTAQVPGVPENAVLKRRILQVLADHAHERGLTQAEVKGAVTARWYPKDKAPSKDSWSHGWTFVTSQDIAINLTGERWALDQVMVSELREKAP